MRELREQTSVIRTPDYRLRVFVSSTLKELAEERDAVRQAILQLRLAPVMFEMGARPHPADDLYQAYLAQSHIFIGIYWRSYGWIAPGKQVSGLEDEYNLSTHLPRLMYIKQPDQDREPALTKLLDTIRSENVGCYKSFETPDELKTLVENDLALLLTERFEAAHSEKELRDPTKQQSITNVPFPRNALIGRDRELRAGCDMLLRDDVGLVTLTGPGGSGKSRLGIQIALELRDRFRDGVYLVGLDVITDPDLVIPAIAKTLGVAEATGGLGLAEALIAHLRNKQVLLFLDNVEQVLSAAPKIANLLEACPQTKVLVTSRAPLHLRAEKELPVPPLALPPLRQGNDPKPLSQYAAVQLFIQRAQAVKPDFMVTNENAPAVAEICHRLDGLPLAIELASARIRMLSPHALLERLEQSFELLRDGTRDLPERQKTLYSAIDWSYNLLRADEKRLLRRLSVFVGGWTFETADAVCNADSEQRIDIFAGLERLVDFNLIMPPQEVNGELRLKFLETIREFSMQRLVESGEAGRCGQAHGQFFLNLAEEAEPHLKGAQQTRWVARLEREHENLRGALEWALGAGKGEEGLRLAGALGRFWMTHGHLAEGRQWLKRTLEVGTGAPQGVRAKALRWAGALAWNQGDYARARRLYEEGLEILRELGDKQGIAIVLNNLGLVANSQGDYTEAGRLFEGSQAIYRELGDKWGIATTIVNLGLVSEVQEDYTGARRLFEESLAIHRQLGDKQGAAIVLINLGVIANKQGDHSGACNLFDESLTICHELGDKWGIANALDHLGLVMQVQGDQIQARKLHEESLVIRRDLGDKQGIADALSNLGIVAGSQGEYAAARRYIEESLVICRDLGDKQSIANALSGLASVMHAQEEKAEHAAQLQGAVTALIERLGVPLDQLVKADYKRTAAALQVKLGEGGYAAAFEAGRRFTLEEAVSLALTGPEPDTMTSQHR